jgi:hypothetical protein
MRNLRFPSPPILLTGTAATFLVVQAVQVARAHRPISGSVSLLSYGGPTLLESCTRFAAVSLAGLLIARREQRVLFSLPCLALMLSPALFWAMRGASPTPSPIGLSWTSPWLGVVVDGLLALTPAAALAVGSSSMRARPTAQGFGAIGACAAVSGIIVWVRGGQLPAYEAATFLALFLVGALLGSARPWWPWAHVVAALLLTFQTDGWVSTPGWMLSNVAPFAGVALVAGAWEWIGRRLRRAQDRPLALLVLMNVLNAADALLTVLGVRLGVALESNPFVRSLGIPLKLILVATAGWLLYRIRPRVLLWPTLALLVLLTYHLGGWLLRG